MSELGADEELVRSITRHLAVLPKGFLRYYVLKALSQKPLSGSEIADALEKLSNGLWRPSPGSLYPLISSLRANEYIEEVAGGGGVKRFRLTQKGKKLLETYTKIRNELIERVTFMRRFWVQLLFDLPSEVVEAFEEFTKAVNKVLFAFENRGEDESLRKRVAKAFFEAKEVLEKCLAHS